MRILKKKITYKTKPYIVIVCKNIDLTHTHYVVYIRKPYCYKYLHEKSFDIFTVLSLKDMIIETLYEYIVKKEEISEIDKIKEWDGVIHEL